MSPLLQNISGGNRVVDTIYKKYKEAVCSCISTFMSNYFGLLLNFITIYMYMYNNFSAFKYLGKYYFFYGKLN